jgi:hypothetical protein
VGSFVVISISRVVTLTVPMTLDLGLGHRFKLEKCRDTPAMAVLGPAAAAEPIELTQSVADLVAGGEVDYGDYGDFGADGPHRISVVVRLAHLPQ